MDRGTSLALAAAVLFGVSGVVAAGAFDAIDPVQVAQFRSVLAAFVLVAVAYRRRLTTSGGRWFELATFGGLLAGQTITYYWAIDRLGVGPGVTLQFLGPAMVLVWMRLIQRRTVPRVAWGAALTAVAGTALMNRVWDVESLDLAGLAAGLGAAAFFAGYLILGERLGQRLPVLTVTAYGFAVSGLIWVLVAPVEIPHVAPVVWGQLAWVALLGTAAPFFLEVAALRHSDPGRIGVVATAEPVIAALVAWPVLGQRLGPLELAGIGLVVTGIAVIQSVTHSVAPGIVPEIV